MSTLGERIKQARGKTSQDAFAKQLNISKGSLGFYERNENLPNVDVALKICSETGVTLEWLLTGSEPMRGERHAQAESSVSAIYEKRIAELEKELAKAKDEALKAYRLAVEALRAQTKVLQEPGEPTMPNGEPVVIQNMLHSFRQKNK